MQNVSPDESRICKFSDIVVSYSTVQYYLNRFLKALRQIQALVLKDLLLFTIARGLVDTIKIPKTLVLSVLNY
jgi:hypothetical protein